MGSRSQGIALIPTWQQNKIKVPKFLRVYTTNQDSVWKNPKKWKPFCLVKDRCWRSRVKKEKRRELKKFHGPLDNFSTFPFLEVFGCGKMAKRKKTRVSEEQESELEERGHEAAENRPPSEEKSLYECLDSSYSADLHKSISYVEKLQASLALELEKARQEKLIADHRVFTSEDMNNRAQEYTKSLLQYNNKLQRDLETTSQSHSQLEMVNQTIVDNLSNFRGYNKALQDQLTCIKDRDRLVTEIRVLTAKVAKYKEFTRKSYAKLDNLIVKSKALERICVLEHQLIATNEKLKMANLSTSEIRTEVEEQKRIVRDLKDCLVDAKLQIMNLRIYLQDDEKEFLVLVDLLAGGSSIVCIFAYGQTGSSKTYTMMGRPEPQDEKGIIPRSLEQIFQTSQSHQSQGWKYKMQTIRDLLATNWSSIGDMIWADNGAGGKQYAIKHDANRNTYVYDLTIVDVSSIKDISSLLHQVAKSSYAQLNMSVGKTQMNKQSSRSHVVFTLRISSVNEGVVNHIDFAGSERLSRSGATGDCDQKNLSSLTDVIFALAKKEDHVPFKNSKLTFLLQTLIFVNISLDPSSVDESLCSLKFTTRVNDCEIGIP
ncbi:hypothetical protein UlMin_040220 [Ulmus minor]